MKSKIIKNSKRLCYNLISFYFKHLYSNNHKRQLVQFSNNAGVVISKTEGENEFIKKWQPIYNKVNVDFYRFYSHYIGNDSRIVSDDIFHYIIEPVLNSRTLIPVFSNKNMFEKILDRNFFPICILRNIEYDYMDRDYNLIKMNQNLFDSLILNNEKIKKLGRFIVKPTTNSSGGKGVKLFVKNENDEWVSTTGEILSLDYLNKYYKSNFIIQQCIEPSAFIKQFNPTSYSTLRLFIYRSVNDNMPYYLGGYLRVGAQGSFKDNVWGGGFACPIMPDGSLANFASDAKRKRYDNINGISLTENTFQIPNWKKVIELVNHISTQLPSIRLISYDIILDKDNMPKVIEFNTKAQTVTTIQTTTKPFFGEFTDEVIEYCKNNLKKISYHISFQAN